ncbi:hypothetical protein ACJ41O_003505 [Fusarium nematophilum]
MITAPPRTTPGNRGRHEGNKQKQDGSLAFSLRTGKRPQKFARLDELRANSSLCPLCNLASRAIERYGCRGIPGDTQSFLTWEVDGRAEDSANPKRVVTVNKTRRLRLSWGEEGNVGQVYLVLTAPNSNPGSSSDIPSPWAHFLGRELHDQTEKQALIKSWLDLCLKKHKKTCSGTHGTDEDHLKLVRETYFGVIDVVDMQLKGLPIIKGRPAPYVALSYVWGADRKRPRYMTTNRTVMTHIKHGGLGIAWAKLPRTIQDAILLVSRLGERYIWIDSLCIVQDRPNCWENNARAMHLIYGHAHFTICAADGDAHTGLCAAGPLLRATHPAHGHSAVAAGLSELNSDSEPLSIEYAPGTRLLVTRPLEVVIYDSAWSKRAWTFQEQILSTRCLIFAEGRIYFQCRFAGISEDIWTDSGGNGWSLNRTTSPLQSPDELKSRPIWFYMRYVRLYTSRNLTMQRDILSAFEGITWLLREHMNHEQFLFGLPTSHFDLALLWTPTKSLQRRRRPRDLHSPNNKECTQDATGYCTCHSENDSLGGAEFPSWAWCGWMGDKGKGGQAIYDEAMLEGCLLNIRQWLDHRTWIKWFIRDAKGHLRPVRRQLDRMKGREFYDEDRWNGYSESQAWRPVLEDPQTIDKPSNMDISTMHTTNPRRRTRDRSPSPTSDDSYGSYRRSPSQEARDYLAAKERRSNMDSSTMHATDPRRRTRDPSPSPTRDTTYGSYRRSSSQEARAFMAAREASASKNTEAKSIRFRVGKGGYLRRGSAVGPRGELRHHSPVRAGRARPDVPEETGVLKAIIPDNPFGTIQEFPSDTSSTAPQDLPLGLQDMPILQFSTWLTELYVTERDPPGVEKPGSGMELRECDIADDAGDWCGSIAIADDWIRERQSRRFHFIAISEAKKFTTAECPIWTYYIPKEREESQWDLYYVLLVELDDERCLWERIALGKVFWAAFERAEWAEIKLG